jgi:replicative DNA helicase
MRRSRKPVWAFPSIGGSNPPLSVRTRLATAERELLNATYEIQQQVFAREHRREAMIERGERAIFALRGNRIQTRQRLVETAVDERQRVLFASPEMGDAETAQRHLAAESAVDPERLHLGQIRDRDWPVLLTAAARTAGAPFHLLDDSDSDRAGEMNVIVRKNRQGRLATVTLHIDRQLRYTERPPRMTHSPFTARRRIQQRLVIAFEDQLNQAPHR